MANFLQFFNLGKGAQRLRQLLQIKKYNYFFYPELAI